jgi:hypothetical protein
MQFSFENNVHPMQSMTILGERERGEWRVKETSEEYQNEEK